MAVKLPGFNTIRIGYPFGPSMHLNNLRISDNNQSFHISRGDVVSLTLAANPKEPPTSKVKLPLKGPTRACVFNLAYINNKESLIIGSPNGIVQIWELIPGAAPKLSFCPKTAPSKPLFGIPTGIAALTVVDPLQSFLLVGDHIGNATVYSVSEATDGIDHKQTLSMSAPVTVVASGWSMPYFLVGDENGSISLLECLQSRQMMQSKVINAQPGVAVTALVLIPAGITDDTVSQTAPICRFAAGFQNGSICVFEASCVAVVLRLEVAAHGGPVAGLDAWWRGCRHTEEDIRFESIEEDAGAHSAPLFMTSTGGDGLMMTWRAIALDTDNPNISGAHLVMNDTIPTGCAFLAPTTSRPSPPGVLIAPYDADSLVFFGLPPLK